MPVAALGLTVAAEARPKGRPLAPPAASKSETTANSSDQRRSSPEALSLLGQGLKYLEQARYEQAIEAFHKALDLDPALVTAHYDLGVA